MSSRYLFVSVYSKFVIIACLLAAVCIVTISAINPVSAVDTSPTTFKLSPVRTDLEINPGASKTIQMTVTNLKNTSISVKPALNDFIAGDERGTPALLIDEETSVSSRSLKRFIQPLSPVTIPAKQSKVISVDIKIPKMAKPGGYFGAIRFAPLEGPIGGQQVSLEANVASLILVTVSGDTIDKLRLTEATVAQNGNAGSFFINGTNLATSLRFENKGATQLGPFGKISLSHGDEVIQEIDFNSRNPHDMVLPDSARRWDIPLQNIESFGKYTVSATITYGKKNQTIEIEKTFWVIPQSLLLTAGAGLLLMLLVCSGVFLRYRKGLRKNARRRRRMSFGS